MEAFEKYAMMSYRYIIIAIIKLSALDKKFQPLRKHTYSNILKILQPKKGKFSDKKI